MKKIDADFDKVVEIFNSKGKEAAKRYVEDTYNCLYPAIQRRLKEEGKYKYSRQTKKYEPIDNSEVGFMTLEELYMNKKQTIDLSSEDKPNIGFSPQTDDMFKDVVVNLMKDKIQEISKYIHLQQSTKLVSINLKRLEENGYKVILD